MPAIAFRPKCKGRNVRRFAHRRPGVGVLSIAQGTSVDLLGEIDEHRTIWADVGTPFVDPAVKPLAAVKGVFIGIPFDDLNPLRGSPSKYNSCWCTTGEDEE